MSGRRKHGCLRKLANDPKALAEAINKALARRELNRLEHRQEERRPLAPQEAADLRRRILEQSRVLMLEIAAWPSQNLMRPSLRFASRSGPSRSVSKMTRATALSSSTRSKGCSTEAACAMKSTRSQGTPNEQTCTSPCAAARQNCSMMTCPWHSAPSGQWTRGPCRRARGYTPGSPSCPHTRGP